MKYLSWSTCLFAVLLTCFAEEVHECNFPNGNNAAKDKAAYKKLKPLLGRRYSVVGTDYDYDIGICTDALAGDTGADAKGVVQTSKKDNNQQKTIGKYTFSSIMAGTNWIYLVYNNGDTYSSHCNSEPRKAVILFTCDPTATDSSPGMKILEEENTKDSDCYYLFELAHPEICDIQSSSMSSLSVGSIILIVFFCVMAVYLIGGAIYQRFVLGAKGVEQLPNHEFWKDFGNLQADGCDFVCRTRDARNSSPYKGLGDDQLEEVEERDDNLLPM